MVNSKRLNSNAIMQAKNTYQQPQELPKNAIQDVAILENFRLPCLGQEYTSANLNILLVRSGEIKGGYDKKPYHLRQNDIMVLLPNHICMEESTTRDYRMSVIVMTPEFMDTLLRTTIHRNFLRYHYDPVTSLNHDQVKSLLHLMHTLRLVVRTTDLPHRREMLLHLMDVMMTLLSYYRNEQDERLDNISHNYGLYNQFCDLLVKHYRESREVMFYAQKLRLTPKHMSKAIHDATGHSALFWIEQHIAIKAKQMLQNRPDMTIQEICYYLGFDQLANFSRYFKRVVGCSPKQYREDNLIH